MHIYNTIVDPYMIFCYLLGSHVDRVVFLPMSHIQFVVESKVEDYKKT